jgi:MFS family permease
VRILASLSRQQKEAVALLQIGTFLEYFDLMLYVHMAVVLNDLFFPKTDPHTASLLTAFAFCSTFVLRPFGALLFGYIGDNYGRKTTVIITTAFMSISCIIMANLPTYAQIGISAAWAVTFCRIFQGLSSMGEIMGALVYMTEITKPPVQYPAVSFISLAAFTGSFVALGMAALVTNVGLNWRIAFWVGAGIAAVGSIARTRLRETPDFIDKINKRHLKIQQKQESIQVQPEEVEKMNRKTILAFFFIYCGWPLCFYLAYMYFNATLKQTYHYSSEEIVLHNFFLSIIHVVSCYILSVLSFTVCPIKILKIKAFFFLGLGLLLPPLILLSSSSYQLFALQALIIMTALGDYPAVGIFIRHIPVLKRVMATSFLYSLSRAVMYVITSFGLVYLSEIFGHWGILLILLPSTFGYLWAIHHYEIFESLKAIKKKSTLSEV